MLFRSAANPYQFTDVPERCFGHPVLVLTTNPHGSSAVILIITSFGRSVNIKEKIQARRHSPQDYLPIHPASPLVKGIPTLFLCASQKLNRNCWVNVSKYYQCSTTWLEELWDENRVSPHLSKKLDSKSLHALALYAVSRGFNTNVYKTLLLAHTPSKRPSSGTVDIPEIGRAHV